MSTCLTLALGVACAPSAPPEVYSDYRNSRRALSPSQASDGVPVELDGSLSSTLAFALAHSPRAETYYHEWRATLLGTAHYRKLPDPMLSYGYFLRAVQTRTGPQRHRFGISQVIPLAGDLRFAGKAAKHRAEAAQRRFEAELLSLSAGVQREYWRVWLVHEEQRLATEHDMILDNLLEAVRARVRTGNASLAALTQVELNLHRHHDHDGAHEEALREAMARLVSLMGVDNVALMRGFVPTDAPESIEIGNAPSLGELRIALEVHPLLTEQDAVLAAAGASVRGARSKRFPKLRLGADLINTGTGPGATEPGEDPVVLSMGATLPVWQGSYARTIRASKAQESAASARREAILRDAEARLAAGVAQTSDSARRVTLLRGALVPTAIATYESTLGSYRVGRANIAEVLLAQRDLLDLKIELARELARHATVVAELESTIGRPLVPSQENGEP